MIVTGEALRDSGSVLEETLLGKVVTVHLNPERIEIEGLEPWTRSESYVGTVGKFEGDEYRHVVLEAWPVIHSILLDAIDRIEA